MKTAAKIKTHGDLMSITFDRFGLDQYRLFLKTKKLPEQRIEYDEATDSYTVTTPARFSSILGVKLKASIKRDLAPAKSMFDYQHDLVMNVALPAKRFAFWWDCGLGKTFAFLEWMRQINYMTGGRVLLISPLNIIQQTLDEIEHFYGGEFSVSVLGTRERLIEWCTQGTINSANAHPVAICNYEKFIAGEVPELRHLAGLVLDESSILKSGGGVIKWNLIKSARGIEYKLSCTATPAPNDTMEYASQAAFLEKLRTEGEILWTFFTRDKGGKGDWVVKPHARDAFYQFMAGWSIYLRSPARYGYEDNQKNIPVPVYLEHRCDPTPEQLEAANALRVKDSGWLFDNGGMGVTERIKLSQIAKGFLYDKGKVSTEFKSRKLALVADLIRSEHAAGKQTLTWTVFDAETDLICRKLNTSKYGVEVLDGSLTRNQRDEILERFRTGKTPNLISKASLLGYGMNFQHCKSMIFSGMSDSYEQFYQAVRRAYRYGQTDSVRVHIPYVPELEGMILQNVLSKKEQFETDTAACELAYCKAMGVLRA